MKMLVSSTQTQGQRRNDFSFTNDGELVFFGTECTSPVGRRIDGRCGCRRSLSGVETKKGTTTMVVADVPITLENASALVVQFFQECGLLPESGAGPRNEGIIAAGIDDLFRILRFCEPLEVGTVVERRGDRLKVRA